MNVLVWTMPVLAVLLALSHSMQAAYDRMVGQATAPPPQYAAIYAQIKNTIAKGEARASQAASRSKDCASYSAKVSYKPVR